MASILEQQIDDYLSYLRVEKGASPRTVEAYGRDLEIASRYFLEQGAQSADGVDAAMLGSFETRCVQEGLAASSIKRRLSALKGFFRYEQREGEVTRNPADLTPFPKLDERLPDVLSIDQCAELLDSMDDTSPRGLRDRALMEVLYGCGLRVSEAVGLDLDRVLLEAGVLRVVGKGDKERLTPIADRLTGALDHLPI